MRKIHSIEFPGPVGRLEGLLHVPAEPPTFAAVVSHAHPLHGGRMEFKTLYRLSRAVEDAGAVVLRYNFRGVGGSEGTHDDGRGEVDDLRAAVAHLRSGPGAGLPLLLAGFSFGSVMSVKAALAGEDADGLLLAGAPRRMYELSELAGWGGPVAFIHGEKDVHGLLPEIQAFVKTLSDPAELRVVSGADHFFTDHQRPMVQLLEKMLASGVLATVVRGNRTPARSDA
ncbi:MAG: alpha/beta family hydrolase [Acidobacteriota bacterium]